MHAQLRAVIHSLLQTVADVPYLNFVMYLRVLREICRVEQLVICVLQEKAK